MAVPDVVFTTLFLLAVGFILYTYALFPLLLHLKARHRLLPSIEMPDEWPSVSVVIAAHNEALNLPAKIESLSELDYPADKMEWIVVSDGSTDDSQQLLKSAFSGHESRRYIHLPQSLGKCGALNEGVAIATGDIIVFMDARQRVSSNALKALVPYLSDPAIGAVSGELVLAEDSSLAAGNLGLYWRYEKWIRDNESRLFSTTGVTGALYAIRRRDFIANKIGTLLDDFNTPINLLRIGKRTLFIPGAYAYDKALDDIKLEFRRKVRSLAGNWQSFSQHPWLFSPGKNPVWWQFLSHKVFRLLVPYAMIIAFFSALSGQNAFLDAMFWAQLLFYILAAASYLNLPGTNNRIMNFIKVFLQLNAAALVGTWRYFIGKGSISWR